MHDLINFLDTQYPLSKETISLLEDRIFHKKIKKREIIVQPGVVCKAIYWVKEGTLCGFVNKEEKTSVTWFAIEGDAVTSVYSFISRQSGNEGVKALEDTEVYGLSYESLQELYLQSFEMNVLGRTILEMYYINLEERTFSLQNHSAHERYDNFIKRYPELIQKIPLGVIASYVGVTQSSLSRLRKNQD